MISDFFNISHTNVSDIKCLHKELANNPIQRFAEEGVAFIKNRQEFWRQQRCEAGATTKRRKPSKKSPKSEDSIKTT